MPFQVNRAPIALNDIIGAKSWPVNQSLLADQVVATVESLELYMLAGSEVVNGAVNATAAGGFQLGALIVPTNEWWFVHSIGIWANMGVGQAIDMKAGWYSNQVPGGSAYFAFGTGYQAVATAAGQIAWGGGNPHQWLRPGAQPMALVTSVAAAPVLVQGHLEITRVRI